MPYTKQEFFDYVDTKVGSGLDLVGADMNTIIKEMYNSIEAIINTEIQGRIDADAAEVIARDAAIGAEATLRSNADAVITLVTDTLIDDLTTLTGIVGDNGAAITALEDSVALLQDYQIVGIAIPSTNPGLPLAGKKAWVANTNGTYTNFVDDVNNPYTINNELVLFLVNVDVVTKRVLANL